MRANYIRKQTKTAVYMKENVEQRCNNIKIESHLTQNYIYYLFLFSSMPTIKNSSMYFVVILKIKILPGGGAYYNNNGFIL